ncbi:MAG: hypothetical protein HY674_00795 [Chloroflexi bacterium]|nr:hypothetical protein [Chloroflexota bacterium]
MFEIWHILRSGAGAAAYNMALDEALLEAASRLGKPVLRFYEWTEPAATFGYFQKHDEVALWTQLRPLIRRPTGGGLVLHEADRTYSLVFPTNHPWYSLKAVASYQRLHQWLGAAFGRLGLATELASSARREGPGQCFVGAEPFDLLWNGRKIAGAAQRRTRSGLLIQGSVQPMPPGVTAEQWRQAMLEAAAGASAAVHWLELVPDTQLLQRAGQLAGTKYTQPGYNRRR